jgi:hypothetical protein
VLMCHLGQLSSPLERRIQSRAPGLTLMIGTVDRLAGCVRPRVHTDA